MVRTLTLLLLFTLAACGRGGDAPLRLQVFGEPAEIAAYRALIAAYQAEHPGRRVSLIPVGQQKDHMAKLTAGFAAQDPPELFIINFRRYGQFAERGVLEPLGPAMTQSGQYAEVDFYPQAVDAFRYRGQLMCLPQNISSLVVYYNRALFAEAQLPPPKPDWTIREFVNAAVKLTRDTDGDGRTDIYGLGFEPLFIRIMPFIWSMGAEIVDNTENPTRLELDRPLQQRALGFVKSLNTRYRVVPPLQVHHSERDEARFARGGLGMILHSRRYTTSLRQMKGLDWDVAPFPRLIQPASSLHSDAYCMAKATRDKPAAMDFVEFALSERGQALIAASGRSVPSRISVAQSPAFLDPTQPPASAQVFLDAIPHLRRTPSVAEWHEVEMRTDQLMEEWFFEPPLRGNLEEGEGAADLALQLNATVQPVLAKGAAARKARP